MRGITLAFLLLLAACAARTSGLGGGQPGLDVARAALHGGSPEVALQVAGGILAKEPGNEDALIIQGEALTALQRFDEAGVSFATVLQRNPASVSALIGLGRLRLVSDPAAAEASFLEALERDPRNGVALNNLGIARDLLGRHTEAQDAYRQALGVSPNMSAAQVNLALSLAMSGQPKDAIQLLRPLASEPGASPQLRHDLAAVLVMGGDTPEAERILSRDLPPNEVRQAMEAFASRGSQSAAANLLTPTNTPAVAKVGAQVQLSAATSEDAAQAEWQRLQEKMPEVLGGHQPIIAKVDRDGRTFWRLRTGGFADAGAASAFCERLRAAGTACMVAQ